MGYNNQSILKTSKNMPKLKSILLTIFAISTATTHAQFTDVINSNRPGESMSAFSVGKTIIQAEAGVYGILEDHKLTNNETKGLGMEVALRYGAFLEQLEFIGNIQFQADRYTTPLGVENRSGIKKFTLGAKYLVYDPYKNYEEKINLYSWKANHRFKWRQFIPAVGVYAGANFGASNIYGYGDEPSLSPKLMVITQNQFGKSVFVTNIIADKIGSDFSSLAIIATLTRSLSEKWSAFIEFQGYDGDYYSDIVARGGAAYLVHENLQIDASISKNVKDTPSIFYGGVGVSWRFDANYNDVLNRIPKKEEEKSKDKKKDKKEKENKKRLDEVGGEPKE